MKSKLIPLSFCLHYRHWNILCRFPLSSSRAEALINPAAVVYEDGSLVIDPGEPKTETAPSTVTTSPLPRKQPGKTTPLLVMIENHQESRPQSGLGQADLVYEAVAEGGITRFMGVFIVTPSVKIIL